MKDWEDWEEWNDLGTEERVGLLKSTIEMADLVELCGHDVVGGKVRPPWNPTERTPSTHIYSDHYYDFGSGKHGDIFDWITEEDRATGEDPRSLGRAVQYIRTLALKGGREPGDVDAIPVRKLEEFIGEFEDRTPVPNLLGLDVSAYHLVVDEVGNILVPHYQLDRPTEPTVYGVKVRQAGGGKRSLPGSQFTHRLYSPFGHQIVRDASCVIVEGESDSWAMVAALGSQSIYALPSGAASWKDAWLEDLDSYQTIYLCFDNDRAGKLALDKVTKKVGFDRAKTLKVPGLYNDVREAVGAGWRPLSG